METPRVITWADGFGNWHAHVTMHYGEAGQAMREAATLARRAITAELRGRGVLGAGYRVRVKRAGVKFTATQSFGSSTLEIGFDEVGA